MKVNQVASALEREKELLQQVLDLAEYQVELLESGRTEDLEMLLSLRAEPLSELAAIEEAVEAQVSRIQNDPTVPTATLSELQSLNLAILSLADRIVELDEKAEYLAEEYEHCVSPENQHRIW